MVYIAHPVQLLTDEQLAARADAIFPAVLAALTEPATRPGPRTWRTPLNLPTSGAAR